MKTVPIKGIIGYDVTLESFTEAVKAQAITPEDEVTFDLSSPGGSVVVGFEIYNEIKNLQAKKKIAQVNGISASIASIIMMAADQVDVSEMSLLMIHKASGDGQGNSDDLAQQIEILNLIDELLVKTYHDRNQAKGTKKLTMNAVQGMLTAETWMKPAEALEYGFIDNVINQNTNLAKLAAHFKPSNMKHLEKLKALLASGGRPAITAEVVQAAVTSALAGRKYSDITEEEGAQFLAAVKASIEKVLGGTMTEAEQGTTNELLNAFVGELKAQESASSVDGQLNDLKKLIGDLSAMVKEVSAAVVTNGTQIEAVALDLDTTKKNMRTFGKKPFSNEAGKLNIGEGWAPENAGHIERMNQLKEKLKQK